jgi:hypothetical protein
MRYILVACLMLVGCSPCGLRQVNVGAPVPWSIGDPSDLRQYLIDHGEKPRPYPAYYGGLTDHENMRVMTAKCYDDTKDKRAKEIGWILNEFCHLTDIVGNHWAAAALVSGGDLNALCDDMTPEGRAAAKAILHTWKAKE